MHAIWKNVSRRWRHSLHRYCHLHCSSLSLLAWQALSTKVWATSILWVQLAISLPPPRTMPMCDLGLCHPSTRGRPYDKDNVLWTNCSHVEDLAWCLQDSWWCGDGSTHHKPIPWGGPWKWHRFLHFYPTSMQLLTWRNSVQKVSTRERKDVKKQAVCSRWPHR